MKTNHKTAATRCRRNNVLVEASKLASSAYHNPILYRAFWDHFLVSPEHRIHGMSFWSFLVRRFSNK